MSAECSSSNGPNVKVISSKSIIGRPVRWLYISPRPKDKYSGGFLPVVVMSANRHIALSATFKTTACQRDRQSQDT
jgi:hypothetical protein